MEHKTAAIITRARIIAGILMIKGKKSLLKFRNIADRATAITYKSRLGFKDILSL